MKLYKTTKSHDDLFRRIHRYVSIFLLQWYRTLRAGPPLVLGIRLTDDLLCPKCNSMVFRIRLRCPILCRNFTEQTLITH